MSNASFRHAFHAKERWLNGTTSSFSRNDIRRGGFAARGIGLFPVSVALVGMRDLRDYLVRSKDDQALNPGNSFNIKQDSATLANFSREDIYSLVGQHTAETGQTFAPEALDRIWELTRGQPWLTNALCLKCVWTLCPAGEPVTLEQVEEAREMLIRDRAVHLDSLAERLCDPRVKRVVQTIITEDSDPNLTEGDAFRLSLDLGLVTRENGIPSIANPIYREVTARVLSQGMQDAIPRPEFHWKTPGRVFDTANRRDYQASSKTDNRKMLKHHGKRSC